MSRAVRRVIALAAVVAASLAASPQLPAQTFIPNQTLNAQFTTSTITVNGTGSEAAWATATASPITIKMNSSLTAAYPACGASGTVKALWNGNLLYLLVQVADPKVTNGSSKVAVWIDLWNDKMSKYEEDDGEEILTASATAGGAFSGTDVYLDRAAAEYYLPVPGGYNAEFAIRIGGLPKVNGTPIGMDFGISAAANTSPSYSACQVYWSNGLNTAENDNSQWGTVVLSGWDGTSPMALDNYVLQNNVTMMNALAPFSAQWVSTAALNAALATANTALTSSSQTTIDQANSALESAMLGLRRAGPNGTAPPYPDPFDLPAVYNLPDPFTFFSGTRVQSLADWSNRQVEIKNLAQYYEYGYAYSHTPTVTGTLGTGTVAGSATYYPIAVTASDPGKASANGTWTARLTIPGASTAAPNGKVGGPFPVIVEIDAAAATGNTTYTNAGYAVLSVPYTAIGGDSTFSPHSGAYFTMYPYSVVTGNDAGGLAVWAWGASRSVDALQYLVANNPAIAAQIDATKLTVTGVSRLGKATVVAGLLDTRFGLVVPAAAGSGGPTAYRYDAYGNKPCRQAPFGNVYPWGRNTGAEEMGDHIWHNAWNSNEMFQRFLDEWYPYPLGQVNTNAPAAPGLPMVGTRIFEITCPSHGYGNRLPYDHHELIAAIAPRAVLIDASNNDWADNPEGDSIGFTGAQPVYTYLGASQYLAYDQAYTNSGHAQTAQQTKDLVTFANMVFYNIPLSSTTNGQFMLTGANPPAGSVFTGQGVYVNDYNTPAVNTFNTYYGGIGSMMPWLPDVPHANLLTGLALSTGTLNQAFNEYTNSYTANLTSSAGSFTLTPIAEDPRAAITVNGLSTASGSASPSIPVKVGLNNLPIAVTSVDGVTRTYNLAVSVVTPPTVTLTSSLVLSAIAGGYQEAITVTNVGAGSASNVTLASATLGTATASPLPQSVATLPAGGSAVFTVTFLPSAGSPGASVPVRWAGTYTGGSFSGSLRSATLP